MFLSQEQLQIATDSAAKAAVTGLAQGDSQNAAKTTSHQLRFLQ